MVPKPLGAQIYFAQPIKKQQPGSNNRMFKFPIHKRKRRKRTDFKQHLSLSGLRQNLLPQLLRQRRRLCLYRQDISYNRIKCIAPSPKSFCISLAKPRKALFRAFKIRVPFQHIAISQHKSHIQFGFNIARAISFQVQIAKPRHLRDATMKKRMRIVQKTRITGVFNSRQPASGFIRSLQANHIESCAAQIRLQNEAIVPGTQHNHISRYILSHSFYQ